jgi:hypothetical protein
MKAANTRSSFSNRERIRRWAKGQGALTAGGNGGMHCSFAQTQAASPDFAIERSLVARSFKGRKPLSRCSAAGSVR